MMDDLLRGRKRAQFAHGRGNRMRPYDEATQPATHLANLFYPSLREIGYCSERTDSSHRAFVCPQRRRLRASWWGSFTPEIHSETLAPVPHRRAGLKQAIEGMRTPWLDIH